MTALCVAVCSCNQLDLKGLLMPTGDGVVSRFEQCKQMIDDLSLGSVDTKDSYLFYVAADPHINKTHTNLDIFNDALRNDSKAAFGVILGDCTDVRDNLSCYIDALAYCQDRHSFDHAIFHVLGNHDLFFKGWNEFKEKIGPSVYWFETVYDGGKDLFISLDTATGTLGRKQTEWFKTFLTEKRSQYRHCIILTHTNFFYTDNSQTSSGNMPIDECFSLIDFLGRNNVSLVLQGHDHYRDDITYDKVRYTVLGAISDESTSPEYLKVEVSPDGLTLHWEKI